MKKMKYYTEIWELKTLTFPLFRYYHIRVKAMNVHSKILFSWQRGKPTGWKASWGSSRIEIPTRAAYRKNSRAESMDLVGYDVSSLVTWVKSLIVNVIIIFIFHIRNLGGTADINSSQWGEVVCAVFFVTIQSRGNLHKFANHACMNEHNFGNFFGELASMSKKEASQMRFCEWGSE